MHREPAASEASGMGLLSAVASVWPPSLSVGTGQARHRHPQAGHSFL